MCLIEAEVDLISSGFGGSLAEVRGTSDWRVRFLERVPAPCHKSADTLYSTAVFVCPDAPSMPCIDAAKKAQK